jgi:hypothetical protein
LLLLGFLQIPSVWSLPFLNVNKTNFEVENDPFKTDVLKHKFIVSYCFLNVKNKNKKKIKKGKGSGNDFYANS